MEAETTQSTQPAQSLDIYQCMAWLHANRKAVITGAVLAAVLGSAIAIYSWKKGEDEKEANARLFALPSTVSLSDKTPHTTPEAFLQIANEFPGASAGQRAELLAAGAFFTQGNFDKAQAAFANFLSEHPGSPLCPQATIGVAASMEAAAKTPEATQKAIAKYLEAIAKYPTDSIAEPAKLTLARLYEEQGKPADALKYYDDLTRGPMGSLWASEAEERKIALLSKNPGLVKTAPAAPAAAAPAAAPAKAPAAPVKAK